VAARGADPGAARDRQRHGYEIGRLIGERSEGTISFHVASLYPTLYRLETRGLIEAAGSRRQASGAAATTG
jgi:DNA-binding PadR family transcriptional regulator